MDPVGFTNRWGAPAARPSRRTGMIWRERGFLTASRLHAGLTKGETRALIVVASPRALGVIREAYSPPCATPSTPNSPRIS